MMVKKLPKDEHLSTIAQQKGSSAMHLLGRVPQLLSGRLPATNICSGRQLMLHPSSDTTKTTNIVNSKNIFGQHFFL